MIELLTTAEMAEADRLTIAAGVAGIALMETAGQAVADSVAARHPTGTRVAVVAGPGNNGGDGFVAARLLAERGYRVRLLLVGDRERLKGDAALAAQRWPGPCAAAAPAALMPAEIVVDALFGAGLDRPVEGVARTMIEAMNTAPCVLAVDLPSGINGTTGAVMGARGQGCGNGDVLPPQDRPCAAARPASLREHSCRRHRDPRRRARADQAAVLAQRPGALGQELPGAAHGRTQIRPRPCGRGVRRALLDRRGAACGARRAARRRGARHHRQPARRARWSTRRPTSP